jgi:hypothetical protein
MKRAIQMTVVRIDTGTKPCVLLQCPEGEQVSPKDMVTTKAIFPEQEAVVESANRVKVLGKGRPDISLGEAVEVQIR